MKSIRPSAVAGKFYPSDPAELESEIERYLALGEGRAVPDASLGIKALIAPHAGYVYSGPIAGSAFALLEPVRGKITRIVHLGPSHFVAVDGLAASSADAFETPLGSIPVDREGLEAALRLPQVEIIDEAHRAEHCLEVHLPFLQRVLGTAFSLIPLVVGDASEKEVSEVVELLWGGQETLFVISSDLSHYHEYETARAMDSRTSRAIENLDSHAIAPEQACGRRPIQGFLLSARNHGLTPRVVDVRNSGDTAGRRDSVVGYGAYEFHA